MPREMFRVLKPGARTLFSDALAVGGMIPHEEIATRSSISYYVYSPAGENERLWGRQGFGRFAQPTQRKLRPNRKAVA